MLWIMWCFALQSMGSTNPCTVGVKLKFPFGFRSTEPKRYTVLTKTATKLMIRISKHEGGQMLFKL